MAATASRTRILLVEDESVIGLAETRVLSRGGYDVERVLSGEEAVERARSGRFDLVLMDINLGVGIDGGEAARLIREAGGPPVVFFSSRSEEEAIAKTKDSMGFGYIAKGSSDEVLLASVRMALGQAEALRSLSESEERWANLVRTAPDVIVSIDSDRKVLFISKAIEGESVSYYPGRDFVDLVAPEDRQACAVNIERVFGQGVIARQRVRVAGPDGERRRFEVYFGPVREGSRVVGATAVMRDVTGENSLAMGQPLDASQKVAEVRAAMADFDFTSVQELLESFHAFTGIQVSLVASGGDFYVSTPFTRACRQFHVATEETLSVCRDADRRVEAFLSDPGGRGYLDYRCANGLRDIAQPLLVEGVHWATLFFGQFLYDDDEVDEAASTERAKRCGWDVKDYLAAVREVPRYSRERTGDLMSFFEGLGRIITSLAYQAFKERILSRHDLATQTALGESDKRYRLLAENVGDVIWTLDPASMRFTYVSPSIRALRGMSVEEALAEPVEHSLSPASMEKVKLQMGILAERIARGDASAGEAVTDLYEQPCKDGGMKWVEITTKPVFDDEGNVVEITGVSRDANARVAADEALKRALSDKDRLYQELQHRVKNSLALIVSLLSLESGTIEEESARMPLDEAQVRVRTIGLLYEQLYRTRSIVDIDLGTYLAEVARAVVESPLGQRGLRLELDCETCSIATDRAVSAGLLFAELASNSVKHAFPSGGLGRIRLRLRSEQGEVMLLLEDDGVGLPEGFDLDEGKGLGSLLITQLAEQLGGRAEARPGIEGKGAGFLVRFPLSANR
jgi:PAS domain S-box-containing protein